MSSANAKLFAFRATAVAALACLLAQAAFGAPIVPAEDAQLTPSQFASSVLRELLPPIAADQVEAQARSVAFELDKEVYRAMPNSGEAAEYREAPAAFQHWLDQSLQSGSDQLKSNSDEYRTAASEFDQFRAAVDSLSQLKFSKPQVEFVAKFLRSYFSAGKPSFKPRDILNAFKHALAEANNNNNSTTSEGEKRAAQFRTSITAEVGAVVDEAVTVAVTVANAVIAADTAALETSVSLLDKIMNALDKVNDLPEPVTALLSVAFPPLNPIIHGIETVTCFWKAKGAWKFESTAAWSPWMYCNVDIIKMLPLGGELKTGLTLLFKGLGMGLNYAG